MNRKELGLTNWLNYYCLHCGDEQEPFYKEKLKSFELEFEEIMEWGECPAHGDDKDLRRRVKLPKEHRDYIPMSHVIRWKAHGEWFDEEGVEVTA